MGVTFAYAGPGPALAGRELLAEPIEKVHARALAGRTAPGREWTVTLGRELAFDGCGLDLIERALDLYTGPARRLTLALAMDPCAWRDYYSLQHEGQAARVPLPVEAVRGEGGGETAELVVRLPSTLRTIPLPPSMGGALEGAVPAGLLLPCRAPHDLLFANQIALGSALASRMRASPRAILGGLVSRRRAPLPERIALAYRAIAPDADVHPTAVVEGSVIGPGARIGAHGVVRYSFVGAGARVHDGAKVELSIVGANAWLMHDLVLYRSVAEAGTFLIHGPYQFSLFARSSAVFATILMDYRADGKPIRVPDGAGQRDYGGRFLGAVVGEDARVLGGCLLAPGRVVPPGAWLAPDPRQVHTLSAGELPREVPLPPELTRRNRALARES